MFEHVDSEKLMEEVDRYLTAVDLFRQLGHEPTWRPEGAGSAERLEHSLSDRRDHRVVH